MVDPSGSAFHHVPGRALFLGSFRTPGRHASAREGADHGSGLPCGHPSHLRGSSMVRRSWRRPAFRVLAYSTAAALVAVGLTSVAAAADPEPAGPATTTSTGTATTPPVAPSTTSPTDRPDEAAAYVTDPDDPDNLGNPDGAPTQPRRPRRAAARTPRHRRRRPARAWLPRRWPPTRSTTGTRHWAEPRGRSAAPSAAASPSPAARYRHSSTGTWLVGTDRRLGDPDGGGRSVPGDLGSQRGARVSLHGPDGDRRGTVAVVRARRALVEQRHRSVGDGRLDQRPLPRHQRAVHSRLPHQGRRADRRRLVAVVHRRGDLVQPVDGGVGDVRLHQRPVPRDQRSMDARIPDRHRELASPVGVGSGSPAGELWWSPSTGAWETYGGIDKQYRRPERPVEPVRVPDRGRRTPTTADCARTSGTASLLSGVQRGPRRDLSPGSARRTCGRPSAPGCPVGPSSLTLIRLNYWGFDNAVHRGEIIVRSDLAGRVATVFGAALADHYPIRKMWRVDCYGGDDPAVDGRRQHVGLQLPPGHRGEWALAALLRHRHRPQHRREPLLRRRPVVAHARSTSTATTCAGGCSTAGPR